MPLSVSYYGDNGIHPGLKLGSYWEFKNIETSKNHKLKFLDKNRGNKEKVKALSLDYNLGFYSFANNHNGYFTNVGLSYLRTNLRKNRQFGYSLEVGYLRRDYKFQTIIAQAVGSFSESNFAGNNALLLSFSPVFGKEFMFLNKGTRFFVKPIVQVVTYNHTMLPNASLELGIVYNVSHKK
jgi:hypothetical protein